MNSLEIPPGVVTVALLDSGVGTVTIVCCLWYAVKLQWVRSFCRELGGLPPGLQIASDLGHGFTCSFKLTTRTESQIAAGLNLLRLRFPPSGNWVQSFLLTVPPPPVEKTNRK